MARCLVFVLDELNEAKDFQVFCRAGTRFSTFPSTAKRTNSCSVTPPCCSVSITRKTRLRVPLEMMTPVPWAENISSIRDAKSPNDSVSEFDPVGRDADSGDW